METKVIAPGKDISISLCYANTINLLYLVWAGWGLKKGKITIITIIILVLMKRSCCFEKYVCCSDFVETTEVAAYFWALSWVIGSEFASAMYWMLTALNSEVHPLSRDSKTCSSLSHCTNAQDHCEQFWFLLMETVSQNKWANQVVSKRCFLM